MVGKSKTADNDPSENDLAIFALVNWILRRPCIFLQILVCEE